MKFPENLSGINYNNNSGNKNLRTVFSFFNLGHDNEAFGQHFMEMLNNILNLKKSNLSDLLNDFKNENGLVDFETMFYALYLAEFSDGIIELILDRLVGSKDLVEVKGIYNFKIPLQ